MELYFYRCALKGEPRPLLGQEMRWVPRDELGQLGFPPADAELIEMLTEIGPVTVTTASTGAAGPRRSTRDPVSVKSRWT